MKARTLLLSGAVLVAVTLTFPACTSVLGDFEIVPSSQPEAGATGKAMGEACTAAGECGSGFCADGVCCESACNGTCESCALTEKGKCAPVPDGQDPDKECVPPPRPVPDGGGAPSQSPDGGGPDAGGSDDAGSGGDGGTVINAPDGGLVSNDGPCAGSCNGNRKCKFPGKEIACGTQFCNSPVEGAGLMCDGAGRCELAFASCNGFACVGDSCKKACSKLEDCDADHFCKDGACRKKLADGQECSLPTQCASGFCVIDAAGGVCCNSECDKIPGGNCKKAGSVGQCKCNIDCGGTSCRLFYKDFDGDKHGDVSASPSVPNTTQVGCEGSVPPGGFSAVKDDCNDQDPRVFPGQTEYFDTPAQFTGGYDFNCDKAETKQTNEYPGGACQFCAPPKGLECSTTSSTCYYDKQPATLTCQLKKEICVTGTCYSCDGTSGRFGVALDKGFTSTVPCGGKGTYTDCGSCLAKGDLGSKPVTTDNYPQKCR